MGESDVSRAFSPQFPGTVSLGDAGDVDKFAPKDKEAMLLSEDAQIAASGGGRPIVHGIIPDSGAKIALAVPLRIPTGSLAHLRLMIVLISLIVGLLPAGLFWKLRNTIVQPLAALFLKMRKFSSSV